MGTHRLPCGRGFLESVKMIAYTRRAERIYEIRVIQEILERSSVSESCAFGVGSTDPPHCSNEFRLFRLSLARRERIRHPRGAPHRRGAERFSFLVAALSQNCQRTTNFVSPHSSLSRKVCYLFGILHPKIEKRQNLFLFIAFYRHSRLPYKW